MPSIVELLIPAAEDIQLLVGCIRTVVHTETVQLLVEDSVMAMDTAW